MLELLNTRKISESTTVNKISDDERQNFDEERTKLYKQLDERVRRLFLVCPFFYASYTIIYNVTFLSKKDC